MSRVGRSPLSKSGYNSPIRASTSPTPNKEVIQNKDLIPVVTPNSSVAHIKKKKTTLPKPKTKEAQIPDVPMVVSTKKKIDQLLASIQKICVENESTPEIEEEFRPALTAVQTSLPDFYTQAVNYFSTLKKMQDTAKQNMMLSSAMVRKQLAQFSKDWKFYCETLDRLSNEKPSPHGKHITMNFLLISHTLDVILKSNNNRVHPCSTLIETVYSIQSLGDNLSQSIVNLFSQPTFPNFQADLLSTYKHDVKAYLRILTKAFVSEFPKSGIQVYDLTCIKSDVFTQINEILSSLESAFTFHSVLGESVALKNEINETLKILFDQLSIEFFFIKPNPEVVAKIELERQENHKNGIFTPRKPAKKPFELDPVTQFVQNVSPKIGVEVFKDNPKNLRLIQEKVLSMFQLIKDQNHEIAKLKSQIERMDDFEELYKTQSLTYGSLIDQTKNEIHTKEEKIKGFDYQVDELKTQINKKSEQIWNIQCQVCEVRDILSQKLCKPIVDPAPQSAIPTMIKMLNSVQSIKELHNQILDKENQISNSVNILKEITKSDSNQIDELTIKIKEILEFKKQKITFYKNKVNENKQIYDKKLLELKTKMEDDQIDAAANLELEKEKYAESTTNIIKSLNKIDCSPNSANTIDDAIKHLSKHVEKLKNKIDKKKKKIKKKKDKKNELRKRLAQEYDLPDEYSFKLIIEHILLHKANMRNLPQETKKQMSELTDKIHTLFLRLLGLAQLDLKIPGDIEGTMNGIFELIDKLQDERDKLLKECEIAMKVAGQLRNCFITLEQRFCQYLGQSSIDIKKASDEDLMERIHLFVDAILDPDFNSQYMKVNEIKAYFGMINVDETAIPSEYIPAFCKVFDQMESSLNSITPFSHILNQIYSIITEQSNFQIFDPSNNDNLAIVTDQIDLLQRKLNLLVVDSIDSNLYTFISKSIWLIETLFSQINNAIYT
ncbi:hypothetical protein TRFO_41697 [Tritrichomonas foetus]|uniref:Uncharacterized protein n=1 Tax=Tritrichomonas foetus TaxID=1144522 RepID=A0A1J4KZL9_9EUKA|nr:hypothetical protein TRFO_41697 [Tritrichomonas foetus]|eukprot:OHT16602.1 hypothetical protein TRFO_41697 [Tritrichomonas foetus]